MPWGTDLYSVDDMQYMPWTTQNVYAVGDMPWATQNVYAVGDMPWTTQNVYAVDDIDVVHGI